jgi:hypothetical protein
LGSLFEPHHEQNLSANPKRTAKFIRSEYKTANHTIWFKKKSTFFYPFKPAENR